MKLVAKLAMPERGESGKSVSGNAGPRRLVARAQPDLRAPLAMVTLPYSDVVQTELNSGDRHRIKAAVSEFGREIPVQDKGSFEGVEEEGRFAGSPPRVLVLTVHTETVWYKETVKWAMNRFGLSDPLVPAMSTALSSVSVSANALVAVVDRLADSTKNEREASTAVRSA